MKLFYCDQFVLPLPAEHRFPMAKYRLLRERVVRLDAAGALRLRVPPAATDEQLRRAHTGDYLRRVCAGSLGRREVRRLGFPWSVELVERARRSVGGTIAACRAATQEGIAVNLAGGTHHAFSDRGEGYCVFNDAAVAARAMQAEQGLERVLVVDCDVHQGDGTAAIFVDDDTVFTFSIHGARNYPFRKEPSDLDIALADGVGDTEYVDALGSGLAIAFERSRPRLVVYVSGADAYAGDRLGRLALTKAGMGERDRVVMQRCRAAGVPVAVVMGGGYSDDVDDIVDIHAATVRTALEVRAALVGAR